MKIYVKPSMEVIKLCPEEGIACFGSGNNSGDGGHQGGGHHGGESNWSSFWVFCNW